MRSITGYEMLWLFFLYSFAGWVLETIVAAVKQKKFVNRGLINGPLCIIYGCSALIISVGLQELTGFWLFLFSAVYASVVEWIGVKLMERAHHRRWWNHSRIMWNLDGYVSVPTAVVWGILGYSIVTWGNTLFLKCYALLPTGIAKVIVLISLGCLCLDILASYILMRGNSKRVQEWEMTNEAFDEISSRLGGLIEQKVERRLKNAYPKSVLAEKEKPTVFAQGCGFYKIVWLFIIGSLLGDITETIFCRIRAGVWMSRSSLIWGPFSIVWGFAIAAVTMLLYKYKDRGNTMLFIAGTLLGGAYEYLCSVLSELVFGQVFWDYSKLPFNLGGRINLLYCFFWGIAAVVWFQCLYPPISNAIEKIAIKPGVVISWILIIFMSCNMIASFGALVRYDQRSKGVKATMKWQTWMDTHYNDQKMKLIYPNGKKVS